MADEWRAGPRARRRVARRERACPADDDGRRDAAAAVGTVT
ncbi:hypothetical protein [Actinomyces ruminicola]|nr:hypothetical protein [Actinomyces ruminicola]